MAVELDQHLGDVPVQFRECQGSESNEFLQLFPNGVRYAEGGVDSAFNKVERDVWPTRLLQLKGRRNVRVSEVPVEVESLNSGGVFILDAGLSICQWNGKEASRQEKAKALDVAQAIKNEERGGRASIVAFDEGDFSADGAAAFWEKLGVSDPKAAKVKSAAEGGDDDGAGALAAPKLFKVSDEGGSLQTTEVTERPLVREMLETNDVFVLVAGGAVSAWVGKGASPAEKKAAMSTAVKFLETNKLPNTTPVRLVKEGAEPALFRQQFKQWTKVAMPAPTAGMTKSALERKKSTTDYGALAAAAKSRAKSPDDQPLDDGSGKLQVWRIENFEKVAWPEDKYGHFYGGYSFVVLYSYVPKGKTRDEHMIYFWQGAESSQDEKGASALAAVALDDSLGGQATQVRVVQGKEPGHFVGVFKGKMIVHTGGMASGFKNRADSDSFDTDGTYMYHVRSTSAVNTKAMQVEESAERLNSGDCFVVVVNKKQYIWQGSFSSPDEREYATVVAGELAKMYGCGSPEVIPEGSEPDEFWEAIGGEKDYAAFVEGAAPADEPRLFQICDAQAGGYGATTEEIYDFTQSDLCEDDVMMLDTVSTVYLWIGEQSNPNERKEAMEIAAGYVKACGEVDGRDADTPIVQVSSGAEPAMFTCNFAGWDASPKSKFVDPYQAKLQKEKEERETKAKEEAAAEVAKPESETLASGVPRRVSVSAGGRIIAYAELKEMTAEDGIDMTKREEHLSDAEFQEVFKMSKSEFSELKQWRKNEAKKKAALF